MRGLGTLINTVAIIAGGLLGVFAGNLLKERLRKMLTVSMALCIIALGISGTVGKMLVFDGTKYATKGTGVLLFCMITGALTGEIINIDRRLESFGTWLKKRAGSNEDGFVNAFVTASLTVCIGAMAVIGSIMDGVSGDISILTAKAILDFIIIAIMSATHGKGCIFSAIPVLLLQGTITALSMLISPVLTQDAISNMSMVGNILIAGVGINLIAGSIDGCTFRLKVANMLPSVVFAVIAAYIPFL